MPRSRRICVPGIPLHIVQRGNNRQPCFLQPSNYLHYLKFLGEAAARYQAQIHAYALMSNHVHMLITPEQSSSASGMMQHLGCRYAMYFNRLHKRTGTLWEGRFRSSVVSTEQYVFACYRYIELNPVRAGMVDSPEQYFWSSYRTNALGTRSDLLQPREEWITLGRSEIERCERYRRMFGSGRDEEIFSELEAQMR